MARFAMIALVAAALFASCANAQTMMNGGLCFTAMATGQAEDLADMTNMGGNFAIGNSTAYVLIDDTYTNATVVLSLFTNDLVTMAHFHYGNETTSGPIVVGLVPNLPLGPSGTPVLLSPPFNVLGLTTYGFTMNSSYLSSLFYDDPDWSQFAGNITDNASTSMIYINWHSVPAPNGFERGQLVTAPLEQCYNAIYAYQDQFHTTLVSDPSLEGYIMSANLTMGLEELVTSG